MHEAKFEAFIPLSTACGPDSIEINADSKGIQLNIQVDGMCAFRLNINEFLELKLVEHSDNNVLYQTNLERIYSADLNDLDKTDCESLPCETCEENSCPYM